MARPAKWKDIDPREVQNYASLGCPNTEIAIMVGTSENTIRRRFGEVVDKGRAKRRATIRGWQYEAAKKGNVAMLIWLGKQELGQSDKQENTHDGEMTIVIKHIDKPANAND